MKSLELYAMEWLRYKARCVLLVNERSIRYGAGRPDCLGVRANRTTVEVEVKRSLADFKNNAAKRHATYRSRGSEWHEAQAPSQFYFIVPFKLVARVTPLLPSWAGLLATPHAAQVRRPRDDEARVIVRAPTNRKASRLTVRECVEASALQTNMVLAQRRKIDELKERVKAMERGEFICRKCGLRKDGERDKREPQF